MQPFHRKNILSFQNYYIKSQHLNVGLSVDVFEELLEEPEAALEDAKEDLGDPASLVLELLLQVGQDDADQLDDGYDECPECQRARVEPGPEQSQHHLQLCTPFTN